MILLGIPSNLERFCKLLNGTDVNFTKVLGTLLKFEKQVKSTWPERDDAYRLRVRNVD